MPFLTPFLVGRVPPVKWTTEKTSGALILDCYWVGSLGFNFLGNKGVLH